MTEKGEEGESRSKIRLIESNAKCRYLKKLTCKGTLRQVFICRRSRILYTLPLNTVCINCTLARGGGGGDSETDRRLEGHQHFKKLGRKKQNH
jgi:hypothetical protein